MADEKLIRGIGRLDLIAIVINTIIGAGIFGLPSKVYAAIGNYSLVAYVACALIVGLIVLCYAEVSSRYSETGGPYLYAREAFGAAMAFEVGWLYWVVRIATFAANCNLLVTYAEYFVPSASQPSIRLVLICLVVAGLTVVNIIGVRHASMLTNFFTVGKLIPLLIFIIAGLAYTEPRNFTMGVMPSSSSFASAVLLLIYAFVGFEVAVIPAGEAKDPKRDYPVALTVGLAAVAAIYLLVQIVCIGTLPSLASSERPLADAASYFIGPVGAAFIAVGALISIMGNLNVSLLGGSRVLYAMGKHRELPKSVAALHSRFHTPYISILFNAFVILLLTIYSSFLSALAVATVTRLMIYATTCISFSVFRRRTDAPRAHFRLPLGTTAAVLSIVLIGWLLSTVDYTKEGLPIIILALVGLGIHFLGLQMRKREG